MSLDGKICTFEKRQADIATDDNKELLYEARIESDAVLAGGNMLRLDDPKMTVKTEERQKRRMTIGLSMEPAKVAFVSDLSTIKNRNGDFFSTGDKKILFTTKRTSQRELDFFRKISDVYVFGEDKVNLKKSLEKLYELGMRKVMVEGGGELIFSLLDENLVDEIRLKIGNLIIGGRDTATFVDGRGFTQYEAKKIEIMDLERRDNCIILKCKPVQTNKAGD